MSSQRGSIPKPKKSVPRKTNLATPSKTTPGGFTFDSKPSTAEKSNKKEISPVIPIMEYKDISKVSPDNNGQEMNLQSESDLSFIKMLEAGIKQDIIEGVQEKELKEEISNLRKELTMKNNLVERLIGENNNLRKEMDELMASVDGDKETISEKLHFCNKRIHELEAEVTILKNQNKEYQEEIKKLKSKDDNSMEEHIDKCYGEAKQKMEEFHKKMNEQILAFLDISKGHYENFNTKALGCIEEAKKDLVQKQNVKEEVPHKNQERPKLSLPKSSQVIAPVKRKGCTSPTNSGMNSYRERVATNNTPDRRKKLATLHNIHEILPTNRSENNCVLITPTHDSQKRSSRYPGTPTPEIKGLFRINSVHGEDEMN